jgi:hypothetical protein
MNHICLYLSLFFLATVKVMGMPIITRQPAPSTNSVSLGASLTCRVTASSTNGPISYQWQFNTLPLSGATNGTLMLTNLQVSDAGSYVVIISDNDGSVESQPWFVDVDPTFTIITTSTLNLSGGASGAGWADFNNDGFPDLLIVGKGGGTTMLCSNQHDGTFTRLAGSSGIAGGGLGGAAWADFDNDGFLDVFVGGANALYRNNGNGTFAKTAFPAPGISSYCASWADYDNDGFVDLIVGNYYTGGLNALFHNNGNATFTKVLTNIVATDKGNSQGLSWADYDNDGLPDLFVANTGGQRCFLYHNDGGGNFTKITNSPVTTMAGNFACGAWGDYDNDGFPDLFVCGYNQRHLLFHNNGDGTFTSVTNAGPIVTDTGDDQSCAWADYDNDGFLDLFVTGGGPTHGMKDFLYHNNADGTFTRITRGSLVNDNGEGAAAAWADYNRDGFLDLFVSNFQNLSNGDKANYLYLNSGNSNHWLVIHCAGRISNRAAIGAKVRVKASIRGREMWQLREISGGGNYVSQSSLEAAFGLGDATQAEIVRIEWPSGAVQQLTNIAAKQYLTVNEPAKIKVEGFEGGDGFRLILVGGKGLVYALESSSDLTNWTSAGWVTNQTGSVAWTNNSSLNEDRRFFRAREL